MLKKLDGKNIYFIKSVAPWMIEELKILSGISKFKLLFIRKPAEFYNEDLEYLSNNGVEIIIAPFNKKLQLSKLIFALKFTVLNIISFTQPYSFVIGIKSILWFLFLDVSIFENSKKIHAQFATQSSILSLMLKKYLMNGITYTFTYHAHDIYFNNKWFIELVSESESAFSISKYNIDYVTANYDGINNEKLILSRLGASKPSVIKDKTSRIFNDENIIKIGLISWFVPKKGIQFLLDAIKILKKNGFSVNLILAGDGPKKQEYLDFIVLNNLEEQVNYIGKVYGNEKTDFFNSIDVFVLPAITVPNDKDGIPVVLMEAVAFSLPIISTNVSGIPEICLDDFNGYLIEEKNAIALADAIQKISEEQVYKRFENNSSIVFEDYNIVTNTYFKAGKMKWS